MAEIIERLGDKHCDDGSCLLHAGGIEKSRIKMKITNNKTNEMKYVKDFRLMQEYCIVVMYKLLITQTYLERTLKNSIDIK